MLGLGTVALPCGGTVAARLEPSRSLGSPTLATGALSRQVPLVGEEGDRGAWGSCSAGYQFFIADLLQQAELEAAQGPEGPKGRARPRARRPSPSSRIPKGMHCSDSRAEILLKDQESCSSMRACRPQWLTRDNARAALSNALTNSRQIQQKEGQDHRPIVPDVGPRQGSGVLA
jgi:hypothetical protein